MVIQHTVMVEHYVMYGPTSQFFCCQARICDLCWRVKNVLTLWFQLRLLQQSAASSRPAPQPQLSPGGQDPQPSPPSTPAANDSRPPRRITGGPWPRKENKKDVRFRRLSPQSPLFLLRLPVCGGRGRSFVYGSKVQHFLQHGGEWCCRWPPYWVGLNSSLSDGFIEEGSEVAGLAHFRGQPCNGISICV